MPPAFHLLVKPTGARCNLSCAYCFFLSKEQLYPGSSFRMSEAVLEAYVRQLFEAQQGPEVIVAWQGGEPTLMGIDFYERAAALVEKYRQPHQRVTQTIQTNGIAVDDEWCAFFKRQAFLVGLSLDGPRPLHDAYRVTKAGGGSFDLARRGWERLRAHDVDVNILCAVHAANADHPVEVYRFFRDQLGARFVQFIPIVERVDAASTVAAHPAPGAAIHAQPRQAAVVTGRSVGALQFGRFLCGVFDEWVRHDVGRVFVQLFDVALASWLGEHGLCIFSPTCGNGPVLEHNGDVYACDHFVAPDHRLGNILETPLGDVAASRELARFGQDKFDTLPAYCRRCEVLSACYGECPRNRFVQSPDGEPGLNYLCEGYRMFFNHLTEPMAMMADALRRGIAPSVVMDWYARRAPAPSGPPAVVEPSAGIAPHRTVT